MAQSLRPYPQYSYIVGGLIEGLNEVDKGSHAYKKAIVFGEKSGKPSEQPMINLASVLAHRSDLDGALVLLQRAVIIAPDDANVREHLRRSAYGKVLAKVQMPNSPFRLSPR